jgi:hypothetical protein
MVHVHHFCVYWNGDEGGSPCSMRLSEMTAEEVYTIQYILTVIVVNIFAVYIWSTVLLLLVVNIACDLCKVNSC